jgi:hypothetical protein
MSKTVICLAWLRVNDLGAYTRDLHFVVFNPSNHASESYRRVLSTLVSGQALESIRGLDLYVPSLGGTKLSILRRWKV